MVLVQIDVSKPINTRLKVYKLEKGFVTTSEVVNDILEKYFAHPADFEKERLDNIKNNHNQEGAHGAEGVQTQKGASGLSESHTSKNEPSPSSFSHGGEDVI